MAIPLMTSISARSERNVPNHVPNHRYIWQWMRRKHPGKRKSWLWDKYWSDGSRPWSFPAVIETGDANSAKIELERAHNVKIKLHVKNRGDANPFDPEYEHYFRKRYA